MKHALLMPVSSLFSPTSHAKCLKVFVVLAPKWGTYYLGNVVIVPKLEPKNILSIWKTWCLPRLKSASKSGIP